MVVSVHRHRLGAVIRPSRLTARLTVLPDQLWLNNVEIVGALSKSGRRSEALTTGAKARDGRFPGIQHARENILGCARLLLRGVSRR